MSKINKIQVDETTYDIEDLSVPSWAKADTKPTYDYSEIQNTPDLTTKQDKIDSTHKLDADLVSDTNSTNKFTNATEKATWDAKSDFSGSYNDLTDKPTIPDVSNFITKDVNDLTYYELKTAVGNSIVMSIDSSTYVLTVSLKNSAGTVLNTQTVDLPLETMVVSGSYDSTNKKIILTLKNEQTIEFSVADLVSGLQSEITSSNKLSADLVDDTSTTNKFVSESDKTTWNSKYDKPIAGIPKTDLTDAVQTSLGLADTALQSETYTGTITSVKMNGSTVASSGEADLGTVLTQHQDISGKLDTSKVKSSTSTTSGDVYDVTYINTMLGDIESLLGGI